ncbi:NAD(P)-dependent dehydrogenase (short-subunit alcohol dehydrogenase family) [Bradyrhizobium sp. JR7.2]|uniref:SDR family oxidoreductase n=1 Tax=Bradyrhizobium barranii subsp. apii TaxID=2819348 RepID=A0A8T5VHR6_9BRAD|nr:SDR family NAD(P)-dependent oxidoreductase [Bradyrhizobium barranii]UPT89862.1 SDR family oxidoreductase [Bradyrhizobium barranii subsp. apii]
MKRVNGQERRAALVTGASGGIGAAICRALAEDGLRVVALDRGRDALDGLLPQLAGTGHIAIVADVSNETQVKAAFDRAQHALGDIAVMVTAAGVLMLRPDGSRNLVAETDLAEWQTTQDVNATGTFLCCREFANRLPASVGGGRIVTLSSVAAQLGGYRSSASYIASKSAVLGLTKVLARELAPRTVTVNSVAPGLIDAPMLRLSLDPADDEKASAQIPLGRLGTPDDVAAAVRFLVSPGASYITGVTIDVNGGYRMQ